MGRYDKEDDLKFVEIPSTALSTIYGRPGVIYEVYDQPGRPQYRWDGSRMVSTLEGVKNPLTGGNEFSVGGKPRTIHELAHPSTPVLKKFGKTAYDITLSNVTPLSATGMTWSRSPEKSRFGNETVKIQPSADTGCAWAVNNIAMTCDPDDLLYSQDIYLATVPPDYPATTPIITITLSNNAALGANYTQWTFDNAYMRSGWNTLKMWAGDDTTGGYRDSNMPLGSSRIDAGTGFDFTQPCQYYQIRCSYMNGYTLYADQIRRGAKAHTKLVIGFDATGISASDNVFTSGVAPLLAEFNVPSYFTQTWVYNGLYADGTSWNRERELYGKWGWDAINHTWNHGATVEGGRKVVTLSRTSNVVTATFTAAHGITVGRRVKAKIHGATPADMNGTYWLTATTATAATYTAAGANGSGSGTIYCTTVLSDVFDSVSAENQALVTHEIADTARLMRAAGMGKAAHCLAWPNNSAPHIEMTEVACAAAGVAFGRGGRGGNVFINEFGIDNPLQFGAWAFESSASLYTKVSTLQRKIDGAKGRGDCVFLFGHFVLDEQAAGNEAHAGADLEYPPGQGGNPAPPAAGLLNPDGGWWYLGSLRLLFQSLAADRASGDVEVMSFPRFAAHMGYGVGK